MFYFLEKAWISSDQSFVINTSIFFPLHCSRNWVILSLLGDLLLHLWLWLKKATFKDFIWVTPWEPRKCRLGASSKPFGWVVCKTGDSYELSIKYSGSGSRYFYDLSPYTYGDDRKLRTSPFNNIMSNLFFACNAYTLLISCSKRP